MNGMTIRLPRKDKKRLKKAFGPKAYIAWVAIVNRRLSEMNRTYCSGMYYHHHEGQCESTTVYSGETNLPDTIVYKDYFTISENELSTLR